MDRRRIFDVTNAYRQELISVGTEGGHRYDFESR